MTAGDSAVTGAAVLDDDDDVEWVSDLFRMMLGISAPMAELTKFINRPAELGFVTVVLEVLGD